MLSGVELNERIRSLQAGRRFGYSLTVAVVVAGAFFAAILLSLLAAMILVSLFVGPLTLPEDAISLSLPLAVVFMFTVGITGLGGQNALVPGQQLATSALRAARSGLLVGLVAGALFGAFWAIIISANALLFAAIVGLSLAPALAFFRAIAVIVEPFCLRLVAGR
jgi:hypothetical protein